MAYLLWLLAAFFPSLANACPSGAVTVTLTGHPLHIEASAQSPIRLEGQNQRPVILSTTDAETGKPVKLIETKEVFIYKDERSIWERMRSNAPRGVSVLLPKVVEISLDPKYFDHLPVEFKIAVQENGHPYSLKIQFKGPIQKGGCGAEPKITPL